MTELIVLVLMGVAFWLHTRLRGAERAVRELSGEIEALRWRLGEPAREIAKVEPEPEIEVEPPSVSVPRVTLRPGPLGEDGGQPPYDNHVPRDDRAHLAEEPVVTADAPARFAFRRPDIDFEELFGRRLPIWLGGIALAVAGVFLVRWSIERGLLSAGVRVAIAFAFGIALLVGAEVAYRKEERLRDPRVRQALAGAGLATLYAAFYLAGTQYGLVGQSVAFGGLALVTALAIGLSFRFGLPSAVLGLIGGFAAPLLVGGEEGNLPVLTLYLGLVTAGLVETGRRQSRPWLGAAALVGGLLWGFLLLASGDVSTLALLVVGLYLAALASVLPGLLGKDEGGTWRWVRPISAVVASLQAGVLIALAGHEPLAWGMYGVLAVGMAVVAHRVTMLRDALGLTAIVALVLLGTWSAPQPVAFAIVATGIALIFAVRALAYVTRSQGALSDRLQAALVPLGIGAVAWAQFDVGESYPLLGLGLAALAILPAVYAWVERDGDNPRSAALFALSAGAATVLVFLALNVIVPLDLVTIVAALAAAPLLWLSWTRRTEALRTALWVSGAAIVVLLPLRPDMWSELEGSPATPVVSLLSWAAVALPFAVLAFVDMRLPQRRLAEGSAALLTFAALAQVVPFAWEAWLAVLLAVATFVLLKDRVAALVALASAAALYALAPFGEWGQTTLASLAGVVVYRHDLPDWTEALRLVLPAAVGFAVAGVRSMQRQVRFPVIGLAGLLILAVLHTLYKQVFAIETVTAFTALGMAERTVWQALLMAGGVAVLRFADIRYRMAGLALIGASLAHFALYSLFWHNPLFTAQAVGPMPVANLLTAAYTAAIAGLIVLRSHVAGMRIAVDGAIMALAGLLAVALLRQGFAGSILTSQPLGQVEDLLRSLIGLLLAAGFLWLGWVRKERSWRVGSLVFALATVVKVFLFDTAGLDGLLRIASFAGLGGSLIALGWVYSRLLSETQELDPDES